jgi:hypothetical protein
MPLALDGKGAGTATLSTTVSASLTTANSPDVIYVVVAYENFSSGAPTVTVSDTAGLTWNSRKAVNNGTTVGIAILWAIASSPLSSDSITATFSVLPASAVIVVFGISGANTSNPFDPNSSVPATATGTSTIPSATITTSNLTGDFVIGAASINGDPTVVPQSGFTVIESRANSTSSTGFVEYRILGTSVSNLTVECGLSASEAWAFVADAVIPAPPPSLSTGVNYLWYGMAVWLCQVLSHMSKVISTGQFQLTLAFPTREGMLHFIETLLKPRQVA